MNLRRLKGKYLQLSKLSWSQRRRFIRGWMTRKRAGLVPCALPHARQLVLVPLADFYASYAFFSETKAGRNELAFFVERLHPGDVVYDIGAFRGAYGAAAKAALGDSVAIHLFEPVANNIQRIKIISKLNRFCRFDIVGKAVGLDQILIGTFDRTDGMLRQGELPDKALPMKVPSISVDSYAKESGTPPSVIKLDVEGWECEVLQGAQKCLRQNKPRLWLELHPGFLKTKGRAWQDLINFLKSVGYQTVHFYSDFQSPTAKSAFHVWCDSHA
jgi:FkbM family methyltransferase